ncbi:MAG: hypothetical protein ACE5PO_01160 [Candidatus Bathyarchaeia archaeon]
MIMVILPSVSIVGVAQATEVLSGLEVPYGLFVDKTGNLHFVEFGGLGESNGALKKLPPGASQPIVLLANLTNPYAVVGDEHGNLYFTDRTGTLRMLRADGTEPEVVMSDLGRIYGLAMGGDGSLYLALFGSPLGEGGGAIARLTAPAAQEGRNLQVLAANLNHPVGIAVNAENEVYFTEYGDNGTIKKLDVNGEVQTILDPAKTAAGLALDASGNLYYADSSDGSIKVMADGTPPTKTLVKNISGPWTIAISADGKLYVAEKSTDGSILVIEPPQPPPYDLTLILVLAIVALLVPAILKLTRSRSRREKVQHGVEKPHRKA